MSISEESFQDGGRTLMKKPILYVSHSRRFDFRNELYVPLRASALNQMYEIILPHESSDEPYLTKEALRTYSAIVAEVSFPATGQGLELGWADMLEVPILCIYRKGVTPSGSLRTVSQHLNEYDGTASMISAVTDALSRVDLSLCEVCGGTSRSPAGIYSPNEGEILCQMPIHQRRQFHHFF